MRDFSCDLRIPLVVLALPLAAGAGQAGQTPGGQPALQGLWTNSTTTPLEHPTAMADRAVLTNEEVAALDAQAVGRNDRPPRPGGDLFVARWESGPPVLAVHGITGSHAAWPGWRTGWRGRSVSARRTCMVADRILEAVR